MLFCEPNYETVGSTYAHCNGSHWQNSIGNCRETDNAPPTFCDFESELTLFIPLMRLIVVDMFVLMKVKAYAGGRTIRIMILTLKEEAATIIKQSRW